ncbi:MAG: methylmalonyl-CoA epimerase, partial [Chloroflexi bacterium]
MSRVEGLAEIVLWVADMEAALQFYRDRFGLEIMSPPEMP